jgi:hypothetical protein
MILVFAASAKAWTSPSLKQVLKVAFHKDRDDFKDWKAPPYIIATDFQQVPDTEMIPHPVSSRRKFWETSLLLMSCTSITLIASSSPASSAEDDPFAQLDSFASSISDRSSVAPSTATPPTSNNGSNLSGSKRDTYNSNDMSFQAGSPPASGNLSEMEAALQESRKRRRIDPRTHG